jgi:outer membrane protein assembly factor BamB
MNRQISAVIIMTIFTQFCFSADWLCFRNNLQRTGFTNETMPVPIKKPQWQFGPAGAFASSPSIVRDVLYIGSRDSTVYAINANSGQLIWKRKVKGWVDSSPLVKGDSLVVGSMDGNLYILNSTTGVSFGELSWGLQLASPAALPDGTILTLIGYPVNKLVKYNAFPIAPNWAKVFGQPMLSSPAIFNDMVVFGGDDGVLRGIRLSDTSRQWSVQTQGTTYLSTAAISDSAVFFAPGDYDRSVYEVGLYDGHVRWQSGGVAALAKGRAGTAQQIPASLLYDLRRMSPHQRSAWLDYYRKQHAPFAMALLKKTNSSDNPDFTPSDNTIRTSSVAVDSKHVCVIQREPGFADMVDMVPQSRFTLLALDKSNGSELWRFADYQEAEMQAFNSSPIIAGDKVFCGWGGGLVYAFDVNTGKQLWSDTLNGTLFSSPAVSNGRLFFATNNGYVYCYQTGATPVFPLALRHEGLRFLRNPMRLAFYLDVRSKVRIRIFNPLGRLTATLIDGMVEKGDRTVLINREKIRSGYYIITAEIGSLRQQMHFPLVR